MVTIRDIANKLGLSVSTVSRALNNNPRISIKTRRIVREYADKVGYEPNYNARSLTLQESNAIGVVFPVNERVIDNIFYVELLRGISKRLNENNFVLSVAVGDTAEAVMESVKSMISRGKIKRFIIFYSHAGDPVIDLIDSSPVDYVTIGKPTHGNDWLYVDNDNKQAGMDATRYLIDELKINHPAFIESTFGWPYEEDRRTGYLELLDELGIKPLVVSISEEDPDAINEFISDHPEIDGVVATDDYIGLKFYKQFNLVHPDVDKHVEIVGFNASLPRELVNVHFHSVNLFPEEMGGAAVDLLVRNDNEPLFGDQRYQIIPHKI
ncbi:LacI family DNA-binding transcriptional regulator [Lentilactobacillus kosonis]|uniref:Maltose operon transcriptional repressor MalR, lacI family n=1 Tax=Lentilactobacillus kosonis TaxID=2810561 RepID=A0A401FJI5_9LACO|nr:LacI family DNA-binding transcriptional regulator [Lentilactobacillus kosonis]GAY72523.1 maltose operon transcriptional repressor MalR, lacI family [Lentilactobacillus kosonis]